MKKCILGFGSLIIVGVLMLIVFVYPKKAMHVERGTPPTASIEYAAAWNFHQSVNSCGPYSAAAVIRIVTKQNVDSEDVARTTPWRFRGYTLPFGVVWDLEKQHVTVDERIVSLPDPDKLVWLRDKIHAHTPVILLIRKDGLLHYVTVLGYTGTSFDVYDSLQAKREDGLTVDANGPAPGNANWTNEQLLEMWNRGGLFGMYKNYAIYPVLR